MIKTAHVNILENSTVILSAGAENPSYPLYRLYDRNIGRPFRASAAETVEVKIDQGPLGNLPADRLLIPAGHGLQGMTLDIKHSGDDVSYEQAAAQWVQPGGGLIMKSWAPITKRYWKFIVTAPSSIPGLAELFLTSTQSWERDLARPSGPFEKVYNVENAVTANGQDRFLVRGEPKRRRAYRVPRSGEGQRRIVEALHDAWGGAKPFWLRDREGNWIYGKLTSPLDLKEEAHGVYSFDFHFLEVLP